MVKLPTNDDLTRIFGQQNHSFTYLESDQVMSFFEKYDSFARMLLIHEAITWVSSYNSRTAYIERSFAFMNFYFEQQLPEHLDYKTFDNETFFNRDFFYYYADILFYQLLSAWDILGHVLNLVFNLNIDRVDFDKAVRRLVKIDNNTYSKLDEIAKNPIYGTAKQLRNDFTHNVPGGTPDNRPQQIGPTSFAYGGSKFTPPSRVLEIATSALSLLEETEQLIVSLKP